MFKIRYITRNKIDINKYDTCVNKAINSRIYANSWYLDIVTDDWSALVLDDYKAVMPIPFLRIKRFFFIKRILQPHFCQQLGVFSTKELNKDEFNSFYNMFISLKPRLYNFNSDNSEKHLNNNDSLVERLNYELDLIIVYDTVYSNYSKNLKRNIKNASKSNLEIVEGISITNLIFLKKESKHRIKNKNFRRLKELVTELTSRNIGTIYEVKLGGKVIASAFFIKRDRYLIHLVSASSDLGRKHKAIPFLFDKLIKNNESIDITFDFEGSMIKTISHFFKSFGARAIKYYSYKAI
jgi:hypothetical protein